MSWLTDSVNALSTLSLPSVLSGAALFAAAESGLGVGIFIPGETAVLVLGATMNSTAGLAALFTVVGFASSAGDHVGYFLGRRYGARIRETALVRRVGRQHWDRANEALRKYGAWAVFFTRLLPVVRTLTPAAAGVSGVAYLRFLPASLTGAFMWSGLYTLVGALAGASLDHIERIINRAGWSLLAFSALLTAALVLVRLRRRANRP